MKFFVFLLTVSSLLSCRTENSRKEGKLVEALMRGEQQEVMFALKQGANLEAINANGVSLVFASATLNHSGLLGFLLESGASPEIRNNQNISPLYAATMLGNYDSVNLLLKYGANPNVFLDEKISTPLMSAAVNNHIHIVELLLANGADPNSKNTEGKTVFQLVESDEIIELLNRSI